MSPLVKKILGGVSLFVGVQVLPTPFVFGLMGLFFTGVFIPLFGLPFDDMRLDDSALVCAGTVQGNRMTNTRINDQATVELSYTCASPPVQGKQLLVVSHAQAGASTGDAVQVEYNPDDPQVSRVQGTRAHPVGWAGLVGPGMLVLGLFSLVPTLFLLVAGAWLLWSGFREPKDCP